MMEPNETHEVYLELIRRGFSPEMAVQIAASVDIVEENAEGKWVIRDDEDKIIAIIDPI